MRGHIQHKSLRVAPDPASLGFCPDCGAPIIGRCPSCQIRIRGGYYSPGRVGDTYKLHAFCDKCGEPFPWATWQDRIYQLENLLLYEPIDDATKLLVQDDLANLRAAADLNQDDQLAIWKRVKTRAPGLFRGAALPVAQNVLSAYLQQKLGLSG